jgi:N-acetylneuraminate synthase
MTAAGKALRIAGRRIAADEPPYVIAELSANHHGRLETALQLLESAKDAGADAVKLQTYTADTITLDARTEDFRITGGLWDGRYLYDLYKEAHTPWEWHAPIFEHARKLGIAVFSSPFDFSAVDMLEKLGAPAYKIASFEIVDLPLIRYVAKTGKPMIISTGMADLEEISAALCAVRESGCEEVALLRCVSGYPAPATDYNLRTIPDMINRFDTVIGLSDHTMGNATAIASIAFGAALVEKHFTLDRKGGGPDDSFSIEPHDLAQLCRDCRTAWEALGTVGYARKSSEEGNIKFRRSLYFVRSLKAGQLIAAEDVRSIRPGYGLAPKYLDEVIGRMVSEDVAAATPVTWDVVAK